MAEKKINPLPKEPVITFRAKDDVAIEVVLFYRKKLLEKGYSPKDPIIRSLNEWVDQADEWRQENCEECNLPTF